MLKTMMRLLGVAKTAPPGCEREEVRCVTGDPRPEPRLDPSFGDRTELLVRSGLQMGKVKELESLLSLVQDPDDRFFYVERLSDWDSTPQWLIDWLRDAPRSAPANLVMGAHLIHAAWRVRSSAVATDVQCDAWIPFFEKLELAEQHLSAAASLDPSDPAPWAFLLRTARGLQLGMDEKRLRFREVVRRRPDHRAAHSQMLQNLCAKWGGSNDLMFEFARDASLNAAPGSNLHALIAEAHVEAWLTDDSPGSSNVPSAYFSSAPVLDEIARASSHCFPAPDARTTADDTRSRNYFAFCFWLAGADAQAATHLSATGNWVSEFPWALAGPPLETFARALRTHALKHAA